MRRTGEGGEGSTAQGTNLSNLDMCCSLHVSQSVVLWAGCGRHIDLSLATFTEHHSGFSCIYVCMILQQLTAIGMNVYFKVFAVAILQCDTLLHK